MKIKVVAEIQVLKRRISRLEGVCAEAYQMAGHYDAPVEALDNLAAASAGRRIPHASFLDALNRRGKKR